MKGEGRRAEEERAAVVRIQSGKWQTCSHRRRQQWWSSPVGEGKMSRPLSSRVPAWGGRDVSVCVYTVLGLPAAWRTRVRQIMNGREAVIVGSRVCGELCQGQSWNGLLEKMLKEPRGQGCLLERWSHQDVVSFGDSRGRFQVGCLVLGWMSRLKWRLVTAEALEGQKHFESWEVMRGLWKNPGQ